VPGTGENGLLDYPEIGVKRLLAARTRRG